MNKPFVLALSVLIPLGATLVGFALHTSSGGGGKGAVASVELAALSPDTIGRSDQALVSGPASALRYQVRAHHDVELGTDDSGGRTELTLGIEGECVLMPLTRNAGGTEIEGRCDHVALKLAGSSAQAFSPNAQALVEQQLQAPFFFTRALDGAVVRMALDPTLDPLVAGLLRGIVAGFQVVTPASPAAAWSVEETDATGRHVASYHPTTDGALLKVRNDYQSELRADGRPSLVGEVRATLRLDDDGALESTEERGHFDAHADLGLPARVTTQLSAHLIARGPAGVCDDERVALLQLRAGFRAGPLDLVGPSTAAQAERDRMLLQGRSLSDLADAWDELPLDADDADALDRWGQARARLQASFEALLRLEPTAAHQAAALVTDAQLGDDFAGTITAALATAGHGDAQAALLELAEADGLASGQRQQAVAQLGIVAAPTTATVAGLASLLDSAGGDDRTSVALALGDAAAGARSSGNAGSDLAFDRLVLALDAATDDEEKVALWLALENTADPRLIGLVRSRVNDPAPQVRAAAAGALRLVFDPLATQLALQLATSTDDGVAVAAARSLRERSAVPVLSSVEAAVEGAPLAAARLELVAWMAREVSNETVAVMLTHIAADDADADVRSYAAQALAQA